MYYSYKNREHGNTQPTLEEMTEKAVKVLKKGDDGFLLMLEGKEFVWKVFRRVLSTAW